MRNNIIRGNNTYEKFDANVLNLPRANFQRIRIDMKEYNDIDLSKCISENILYYNTANKSSIIVDKNANKANSIKSICEYYGINLSEVLSFGDDIIDVDMLSISSTGVAMGNAIEEVKRVADYITLSNDDNCVAYYLENFIL